MIIVLVYKDSIITDGATLGRPLWVTLSKVSMRQGTAPFDISGISFGFDKRDGSYDISRIKSDSFALY